MDESSKTNIVRRTALRLREAWLYGHFVPGASFWETMARSRTLTTPSWLTSALGLKPGWPDRKSTRLNSSHLGISYAVFCLKKKKKTYTGAEHHRTITAQVQTHC